VLEDKRQARDVPELLRGGVLDRHALDPRLDRHTLRAEHLE
jgi:hypothetical protein